jgi:hypothetical protein
MPLVPLYLPLPFLGKDALSCHCSHPEGPKQSSYLARVHLHLPGSSQHMPASGPRTCDCHSRLNLASRTASAMGCPCRSAPLAHLPSLGHPPVVARFSPLLYRLRPGEGAGPGATAVAGVGDGGSGTGAVPPASTTGAHVHPWERLPYRMVWAVATLDSVLLYDTQVCEYGREGAWQHHPDCTPSELSDAHARPLSLPGITCMASPIPAYLLQLVG